MCKVEHNQMTNEKQGTAKFSTRADQEGNFVKKTKATFSGKGSYPGVKEAYKGGV